LQEKAMKRTYKVWIMGGVFCIASLILIFVFSQNRAQNNLISAQIFNSNSLNPPYWSSHKGYMAQNSIGNVWIDIVLVHPNDIQFYYALQTSVKGSLKAEALPDSTLKAMTIQTFDKLNDFQVGIIHATWESRKGQLLEFDLILTDQNNLAHIWHLSPVRQVGSGDGRELSPDIKEVGHWIPLNLNDNVPTFRLCGEYGTNTFALLKAYVARSVVPSQALYLHVNKFGRVNKVNQAEFRQLRLEIPSPRPSKTIEAIVNQPTPLVSPCD
jgi:hypothetical protein